MALLLVSPKSLIPVPMEIVFLTYKPMINPLISQSVTPFPTILNSLLHAIESEQICDKDEQNQKIAAFSTLKAAAYAACKLDIPSNGIRLVNSSHNTIPKL